MRLRLLSLAIASLCLLLSFTLTFPVYAAGVVGNGSAGSCTEAALDTALTQVMGTGGTVTFNCGSSPHTITVTSPKMITATLTIDGGNLITLSGGGTTTVLELQDRLPLLTLRNLTIADGRANPAGPSGVCRDNACGGGVRGHYRASLTVINSKFLNNRAVATPITAPRTNLDFGGGAIYMHSGTLTVSNTEFSGNYAQNSAGGAIHLLHSNMTITDSLFDNNQADYYGGAMYTDGTINDASGITSNGLLYMVRNTFTNNRGKGQGGAGFYYMYINRHPNVQAVFDTNRFINNSVTTDIENYAYGGALRVGNGPTKILNSTFSGNSAQREGGALWTGAITQTFIWNSTFYGNRAPGLNSSEGYGGAIKVASTGGFTIYNSTIANNSAGQNGGGIYNKKGGLYIYNTLLVNNRLNNRATGGGQNCDVTYAGTNNIQYPQGNTACTPGIPFANPKLGPLADNGGFTQTLALLVGSPAIDAGKHSYCLEKDQRGTFRTFDGNYDGKGICDIGAYEYAGFDNTAAANALPYLNFFNTAAVTLDWAHIDWATEYEVEIDNNDDFLSVNYRGTGLAANTLAYSTSVAQEGIYFWRVRAKKTDGTWGEWSPADSFLVRLL